MERMINVPQIFMVMKISGSKFHHSNSEILDLEYFTLKIPYSSIFIGFSNNLYQNVWKCIIYSKNINKNGRDG